MGSAMVRLILGLALVTAACSSGPRVLRPNDATEFRVDVTYQVTRARARECRTETFADSRPCWARFSLTVENVGEETADAICTFFILNPKGEVAWGNDFIVGTLEPGQSRTRSGLLAFRDRLGRLGERRCLSYEEGSTAPIG
jgi:hypothetical protein